MVFADSPAGVVLRRKASRPGDAGWRCRRDRLDASRCACHLARVDASTGADVWRFRLPAGQLVEADVVVDEASLRLAIERHSEDTEPTRIDVFDLDPQSGAARWAVQIPLTIPTTDNVDEMLAENPFTIDTGVTIVPAQSMMRVSTGSELYTLSSSDGSVAEMLDIEQTLSALFTAPDRAIVLRSITFPDEVVATVANSVVQIGVHPTGGESTAPTVPAPTTTDPPATVPTSTSTTPPTTVPTSTGTTPPASPTLLTDSLPPLQGYGYAPWSQAQIDAYRAGPFYPGSGVDEFVQEFAAVDVEHNGEYIGWVELYLLRPQYRRGPDDAVLDFVSGYTYSPGPQTTERVTVAGEQVLVRSTPTLTAWSWFEDGISFTAIANEIDPAEANNFVAAVTAAQQVD